MANGLSSHEDLSRQGFVAVAVVMASILTAFDVRTASIGLPDLRGAFGLSFDEGSWLSTFATAPQILVAPCVGWLIAVFGVKRVMIGPTILYSAISFTIPFFQSFEVLIALHAARAVLLGIFVGATLMTAFRNLDRRYWIFALAFYVVRIPFAQNLGLYTAGSYSQTIGWQWLYWQGAIVAPVIGVLFWFGGKPMEIDRELMRRADWGGMAVFGAALTTLYFALDRAIGSTGFGPASSCCCLQRPRFLLASFCGMSPALMSLGRTFRYCFQETSHWVSQPFPAS